MDGLGLVNVQFSAGCEMGKRLVPTNDRGYVIGESHHRAKRTDHEVDLALELLDAGLSQQAVAEKLEVSRRTVRDWANGRIRGQAAKGFKRARNSGESK